MLEQRKETIAVDDMQDEGKRHASDHGALLH